MKILAVGDSYMPATYFKQAFDQIEQRHEIAYLQVDADRQFEPASPSERSLSEYQGDPAQIAAHMAGVEVLVVHGAPVTDAVLDSSSALRLVCCARGGPVNVDTSAVTARKLPLVITPGKNAEAVADLTLAFLVTLARRLSEAEKFLLDGGHIGDNWVGASFMGRDLHGMTLGLVGFGRVGQRVAARALAFGMEVLVYDPYLDATVHLPELEQVEKLDELLERSEAVSLHARASADNDNLVEAAALAKMKPGSFLVNTARETLVDEEALEQSLRSGHLGGAALDVLRPVAAGEVHPLLGLPNVVVTPHIGGATEETLLRGARMIAFEIERLASGEALVNVANRQSLSR